jgi:integrase
VIPKEEVKNRIDLEYPLPAPTVCLLDLCLEWRRRAGLPESEWLFPGANQDCGIVTNPKHAETLRQQLRRTILRYCGIEMNPHLFRHLAARILDAAAADGDTGAGRETIQRLHGHKKGETTDRHYRGFDTKRAVRRYDAEVLRLRRDPTAAPSSSEDAPGPSPKRPARRQSRKQRRQ